MSTSVSVVIPVFNRGGLIRYTLESVRRASADVRVQIIVVDDGSSTPVSEDLARLGYGDGVHVIRQANQGLLFARLAGLAKATGRCTLFLDSDDLVGPRKLIAQLEAMDRTGADVSYTDTARCVLDGDYDALTITPDAPAEITTDAAQFFITVQPAPHSPLWRTDFLRTVADRPLFPPSPLYNCVAEIWFYHNAAPRPARVVHVPGAHTITGVHPGARLTNHWERLAVASLAVMEAFARTCPTDAAGQHARQLVGEKAFRSWRRLPRGFSPNYERRLLSLWRKLAKPERPSLGGPAFRRTAGLLGIENAGRLFRRFQNQAYEHCRTMSDEAFARLLAGIPPDQTSA